MAGAEMTDVADKCPNQFVDWAACMQNLSGKGAGSSNESTPKRKSLIQVRGDLCERRYCIYCSTVLEGERRRMQEKIGGF
jgi:hypothetical protein